MSRRRFRLVQLLQQVEDERPQVQAAAPPQNRAAEMTHAEQVTPPWLKPSQRRMINLQQQMGNQSAQRSLGIVVQRAPKAKGDGTQPMPGLEQDPDKAALQEIIDTPEGVGGVNDQTNTHSLLAGAITAYKAKKYGMALIGFRELAMRTRSAAMMINVAICEMRLDLFEEALSDLYEVMKDQTLTQLERIRAMAALQSCQKLKDANAQGFVSLPSNVDTENSPLAKDPRAIRQKINSLYRTAESAAKSEDYEAAFNAFKIAQERLPHPVTLLNMGKMLVMLQRYSEASTLFERAMSDRMMSGPPRKITEAELEAAKRFQGIRLDDMGEPPPQT